MKKRRKECGYNKDNRQTHKMVPYVTSVNLLQWALDRLEMLNRLVNRPIANSGHLGVLEWARVQDPNVLGMRVYAGLKLVMAI